MTLAASPNPERSQSRLAGLDGLRGLQVLMIMFIHLNLLGVAWVSLSSFFVLSGFLITRILFADIEGSAGLGECLERFYIRRTLRIFPAYYAYLFLILALCAFIPVVREQSRSELPYAFAYVYNLFLMTDRHHATHLFDHLWSLSVEEQFYLLWPLVVYFVGRQRLPVLLLVMLVLAPVLRWATVAYWPPPIPYHHFLPQEKVYFATYFSTFTHLDAFAFGALINYLRVQPRAWWVAASAIASYLIALPVQGWGIAPLWQYAPPLSLGYPLSLPNGYQYVWGYSVVHFNCALLIYTICHPNPLQSFFSRPFLDWVGKRSYVIYIIHYPVLFAMEPLLGVFKQWIGPGYFATLCFVPLYIPVVLATGHLLHVTVEAPILKLKDRFSTPRRKRLEPGNVSDVPAEPLPTLTSPQAEPLHATRGSTPR